MADPELFRKTVYTPLEEAIEQLTVRKNDYDLQRYVRMSLPIKPPSFLQNKCFFLSRDVATPNFETRKFLELAKRYEDFTPVFWEYYQDKFTPNQNPAKYYLGKLAFFSGFGKKGGQKINYHKVIDFNANTGCCIADVQTTWGQSLIDFHHEFLHASVASELLSGAVFFDASDWYARAGKVVSIYYKRKLTLFLMNAILFENFLIQDKIESEFTRRVFLPAFLEIIQSTGIKPLIVDIEADKESSDLWAYHPYSSIYYLKRYNCATIDACKLLVREQRSMARSFITRI